MITGNITIQITLHAILRDLAKGENNGSIELTIPRNTRVGEILPILNFPAMEVVYVINSAITLADAILQDGDRVDIIPAISGGCAVSSLKDHH